MRSQMDSDRVVVGEDREVVVLDLAEAKVAFGALQELRWRAEEGDETARLSAEEEKVRSGLEALLGAELTHEHVPWSRRESSELARDLRAALGEGDRADMPESRHGIAHRITVAVDAAVPEPINGDLVRAVVLERLRVEPVLTAPEVRDLLRRFYNRLDDEAQRVVRTWLEVRRGT